MPRSAPGPPTRTPSRTTSPDDGRVRPAITRSRVDFPHPDGPTIQTNSLSRTARSNRSMATTLPPRRRWKVTVTSLIVSLAAKAVIARRCAPKQSPTPRRSLRCARDDELDLRRPWQQRPVHPLKDEIERQAQQSDDKQPNEDPVRVQPAHRIQNEVAEPAVGRH